MIILCGVCVTVYVCYVSVYMPGGGRGGDSGPNDAKNDP